MKRKFTFFLLILMVIIIIIPYVWMLSNSFKTTKETITDSGHLFPKELTTEGYQNVLFDSPFFKWLGNSLFITILNTLAVLFTSS